MTKKIRTIPAPLETGQIWQMGDSNLHIGLIGKRLVHYKLFKGHAKRAPICLSNKEVMEKYLKQSKAILILQPPPVSVPPVRISAR